MTLKQREQFFCVHLRFPQATFFSSSLLRLAYALCSSFEPFRGKCFSLGELGSARRGGNLAAIRNFMRLGCQSVFLCSLSDLLFMSNPWDHSGPVAVSFAFSVFLCGKCFILKELSNPQPVRFLLSPPSAPSRNHREDGGWNTQEKRGMSLRGIILKTLLSIPLTIIPQTELSEFWVQSQKSGLFFGSFGSFWPLFPRLFLRPGFWKVHFSAQNPPRQPLPAATK